MIPARVIERKRDGDTLDEGTLVAFLEGYLEGRVEEYQMSAFLMAVLFRGLSPSELTVLVRAMLESGEVLDLTELDGPRIDKHSTGGVGDKVSLVLAPLAAELGIYVPMMAGRGLGHTGGTLDKIESIPGFRTYLTLAEFRRVLAEVGCSVIGQSIQIAPLDRRLYALRDVTATVPSLPLIAASIMSKKLAEGLTGLVLDVKVGEAAFLSQEAQAIELARTMVAIGGSRSVPTVALLTAMDRPLGNAIGNALELLEAIDCLRGGGPEDLRELVLALAAEMALLGCVVEDRESGIEKAASVLDSGRALERFRRLVVAQGGDPRVLDDPRLLPRAPETAAFRSPRAGYLSRISPLRLGRAVVELGGGRSRMGEEVDKAVGFILHAALGDPVDEGDVLATVHARDPRGAALGLSVLASGFEVSEAPSSGRPLVSHRVLAGQVEALD